jgi:starch synthase (maltosyl-transferring)
MVGRFPVLDVTPQLACGKLPAKAAVGEAFEVTAAVIREGHDALAVEVVLTDPAGRRRRPVPMRRSRNDVDRWRATVSADETGGWFFEVQAWGDPWATWRHHAQIKVPAGIDTELVFTEGALLLERALAEREKAASGRESSDHDLAVLRHAVAALRDQGRPDAVRVAAGLSAEVTGVLATEPVRDLVTVEGPFAFFVDRQRALYGSWYELFPRSEGAYVDDQGRVVSGTFRTAAKRLDAVAAMGFDVVYLPPVHPIGRVNRKGPNNTLTPGPDDVGSPWAIGSEEGGHDAVHPDLGTIEDFRDFVARAGQLGLEVALDLALQAAPDHPWATSHPEWFTTRADGTIAYAENPPKKYQDIYPVNFDNDPEGIYAEVLRIVRHWMDAGVRIFRVDNPHTKPVAFWERLLGEVRRTDPDVLFLSEAFTRPAMMRTLGMVGFHQSYTYFTWRNAKWELEQYLAEVSTQTAHLMRPNFFVNTPDILHEYLQYGGPPAFAIRATLAAMSVPSWGMYAGFELFEHVAVRPGSEEYLDSEKYQIRIRDWEAAEASGRTLAAYVTLLNRIRREHPALQQLRNLTVHSSDDDSILVFSKRTVTDDGDDTVIVVVNVDPHAARETMVHLNMPALGFDWQDGFAVVDEVTGEEWTWWERSYVRLDPYVHPAHILSVRRPSR